jgi:excisionase family DNA binding protein
MRIEIENLSRDEFSQILSDALEKASLNQPRSNYKTPNLLTREETAKLLKINLSTLHDWVKKGYLTAHSIGYRRYFKEDEVLDSLISLNRTKK